MVVEFSFCDFFGCLRDQCRALGVEQSQIMIRLGSCPLDQT